MLLQPPDPKHWDPFPCEPHLQGEKNPPKFGSQIPLKRFPLGNEFLSFCSASSEVEAGEMELDLLTALFCCKIMFCCCSSIDLLFPKIMNIFPQSLFGAELCPSPRCCSLISSLGMGELCGDSSPLDHFHRFFLVFQSFSLLFSTVSYQLSKARIMAESHSQESAGDFPTLKLLDSNPRQAALGISLDQAVGA